MDPTLTYRRLCDQVADYLFFFFALTFLTSYSLEQKMANEDLKLALKPFGKNEPIIRAPVCCVRLICGVHVTGW